MTTTSKIFQISSLMTSSGVQFGTSGARGLVTAMTDQICYAYACAFLQHLQSTGQLHADSTVAIAGDLRGSTERIMTAVAVAINQSGLRSVNCGQIPTPALACFGFSHQMPSIMITGSHIPSDRNGIKFNTQNGEILKSDEIAIRAQSVSIPANLFDDNGYFVADQKGVLPVANKEAYDSYIKRYTTFFPTLCLTGMKLGLYQHSTVGRLIFYDILTALGATVTRLGFSDEFVSVDTEAIRQEDIQLAQQWASSGDYDAIISADGDADRPLISDECGQWLRGDLAGILCARYLGADIIVTPVSSNTAVEKSNYFSRVIRTKIGSPYVVKAMTEALENNENTVVGYEANGGFLTACDINQDGRILNALPTRDAILVPLTVLMLASKNQCPISQLLTQLPQRFTASDRVKNFPTEKSQVCLKSLTKGTPQENEQAINTIFSTHFGSCEKTDTTDGLRITFANGDIAHLRPSGNAPEFRCYNESDTPSRAQEMNHICIKIIENWM